MIRILKSINRMLVRIKAIFRLLPRIPDNIGDPREFSYHPDRKLKSRWKIYLENLIWLLEKGEICENYYLYGFEQRGRKNWNEYLDYTSFKLLRNRYNRKRWIGPYFADYTVLLKDKFMFNRMLNSLGFPTPEVIALCSDGRLHWMDSMKTAGPEAITGLEGRRVFCKSILGECADGVFPLNIEGGRIYSHGEKITVEEILERTDGSFIIQEAIVQHPEMSRLFPHSVNSLRIVTFYRKGGPEIYYGLLRAGTGENTSDNWAIGGVLGHFNIKTGRLDREFIYKPGFGGSCTEHPDTGVVFADFRIPFQMDALDMV
ncbi:MAG: hypothetical protein GF417_08205, partial [Candidatus Latescibacteria bacterium]|nr:hypothetical protein [Candidatus Latescibacterota bacterium]